MTKDTFYRRITHDTLSHYRSDDDALTFMVLLHLYEIHLKPGVMLDDGPSGNERDAVVLAALTRHHVASLSAAHFAEGDKGKDSYWYWRYSTETPYEGLGDVPTERLPRLRKLQEDLATHPLIQDVLLEDP